MMHVNLYLRGSRMNPPFVPGGQELIINEILACLDGCESVFVPFYNEFLVDRLRANDYEVRTCNQHHTYQVPEADAIYFGTPTIVNNKNLFPDLEEWTYKKERTVVRNLTYLARAFSYKKLICGLGSGDITLSDRLSDINGQLSDVACYKRFKDFEDWVICKEYKHEL